MNPDPSHIDRRVGEHHEPGPGPNVAKQLVDDAKGVAHRKQFRVAVGQTRINPNVPPELRNRQDLPTHDEFGDFN